MQAKHKENEMGEILSLGQTNRIQSASTQINQHKIRLNGDITEPETFNDELNLIENMSENDSCTLIINSGGGLLDTCIEFVSAIDETAGHVHGHIAASAHSAASIIFLRCHSYSVSKHADMLIHNGSGGAGGKFSDWVSKTEHDKKRHEMFFKDVYQDFLTDQEIEDVLRGVDIWLDATHIEERLERMIEIRTARMEADAEEQAEAFIEAELEGCDEFSADEDTSGHEHQLGADLNKSCVGCTCKEETDRMFQVGDLVRVISRDCGGEDPIGYESRIERISDESHMLDSGWWYEPEELELIKPVDEEDE